MPTLTKALLLSAAANIFLALLSIYSPGYFIVLSLAIGLELLIGILLMISPSRRPVGQGLLVTAVVSLLIGYTVCSANFR